MPYIMEWPTIFQKRGDAVSWGGFQEHCGICVCGTSSRSAASMSTYIATHSLARVKILSWETIVIWAKTAIYQIILKLAIMS